jgi:hypothetical protein
MPKREFSRIGGEVGALICASNVPSGAYPPSPATRFVSRKWLGLHAQRVTDAVTLNPSGWLNTSILKARNQALNSVDGTGNGD